MLELRPYQTRTVDRARDAFRHGAKSVCIVMPTGAGKTRTASAIVEACVGKGGRVLWLAHRRELVSQAARALQGPVRIIRAEETTGPEDAPVTVASIGTLQARNLYPEADMVVLDEAHHAPADRLRELLVRYPCPRIGLTATPERSDGRPLQDLFDQMVAVVGYSELLELGHLVEACVFAPAVRISGLSEDPVKMYLTSTPGSKAVLFAGTVDEAVAFAARIPFAATISADTPPADRDRILTAWASGEIRVVTNVNVLTEGFDLPSIETVILARGFDHVSTYLQAVGRGLRASPGKTHLTVIDLAGVVHSHGLPHEDRVYSLKGDAIGRKREVSLRACVSCKIQIGPKNTCPHCGTTQPKPPPQKISQSVLRKITKSDPTIRERFIELLRIALERQLNLSWVGFRFMEEYGCWPYRWLCEHDDEDQKKAYYEKELALCTEKNWKPGRAAHKFLCRYGEWPPREWGKAP
jgi:superfamily II DNA or RNA helicase